MDVAPLVDERALGHLQAEPRRLDAIAADHLGDMPGELGVRQFGARHVDGHGEVAGPVLAGRPLGELAAGLVQDERVDPGDQPMLLGEGDEIIRRHDPALWMAPAHQRLDADQRSVLQGEERLVQNEQLRALDRTAQLGLEAARQSTDALGGVEGPIAVPACLLGLVHHSVGVADQVVGFGEGIGRDDDPDAAGDREVPPIFHVGGTDPVNDAVADETDVIVVAQIPAQHDELVAAEAGDGVGFPGQERQPAPDLGEHLVAGFVPERVVDLLEVVQVDVQDRKATRLPFKASKSLGKPVHQGGPVREPGHRVVQDLVSESLLRLDLCRHVAGNAERADDLAALVAKRHLCRRNPGTGSVVECLPLQLPHNRLAGADDLLLVLKSSSSVFLAEEVEVSLPDDLLQGAVGSDRCHPACADQEEPAAQVLEVHALLGAVQQVAHAGAFDPAQLLALLRPPSAQPPLDHCNSRSGIDEYYRPTRQRCLARGYRLAGDGTELSLDCVFQGSPRDLARRLGEGCERQDARAATARDASRERRLGTEFADVGRQRRNPCP